MRAGAGALPAEEEEEELEDEEEADALSLLLAVPVAVAVRSASRAAACCRASGAFSPSEAKCTSPTSDGDEAEAEEEEEAEDAALELEEEALTSANIRRAMPCPTAMGCTEPAEAEAEPVAAPSEAPACLRSVLPSPSPPSSASPNMLGGGAFRGACRNAKGQNARDAICMQRNRIIDMKRKEQSAKRCTYSRMRAEQQRSGGEHDEAR